jgi:hypothetical protein
MLAVDRSNPTTAFLEYLMRVDNEIFLRHGEIYNNIIAHITLIYYSIWKMLLKYSD